ncbi:MAG: prolyl oligopeptidase family serine peptidase [Chloroflexi bacterium]|nr:prolyl oligopeptidase family serine peptidase [Chloroflexota bacterium]
MDTLAGVSFLKAMNYTSVALVGHSFGGAVVITAAPLSLEVKAVVALSSQTGGAQNAGLVSPRPLLLVHGEADTRLPPQSSRAIYIWAKQPKELVLYPGAGHGLRQCKDELDALLLGWLTDKLRTSG